MRICLSDGDSRTLNYCQESYFTYAGQEESPVDHDISFRAGIGPDGDETYTPRTLIYDLKGAFGTLRRENALYELQQQEDPAQQGPWSGRTNALQLPPIAPSAYQRALDQGVQPSRLSTDTVRFWSDYNHLFYHPRSIQQLNEYELNSSLMPFDRWQTGEELFANLEREHDLLDRDLRPFLEACDQLQAIQVFTGIEDAWGGFAARYLERISDELGKGSRWVFGLTGNKQSGRQRQRFQMANMTQSLYSMDGSASIQIPISYVLTALPPYVDIDFSSPWHVSALQTALVESITLPTRLRSSQEARTTFGQLETALNNDGNRRLVTATMSLKDPQQLDSDDRANSQRDTRMTNGISHEDDQMAEIGLGIDMSPNIREMTGIGGRRLGGRVHVFGKIESLRGLWVSHSEIGSFNEDSRDRFAGSLRASLHQTQTFFPILNSYPHIFRFANSPEKLAIKARLSTSTKVANQIRELESGARSLIGIDEREAICDGLANMAAEYEEGWSGSDGSDDDD